MEIYRVGGSVRDELLGRPSNQAVLCHTLSCMAWRFDPQYAKPSMSCSAFSRPIEPEFLGYSNTEGYCIRLSK